MTGVVERDHVALWATTSTSSAPGDNGADPNKVVEITDRTEATTMTGEVANESCRVIVGPTYDKVYRGVAHVHKLTLQHSIGRPAREKAGP